MAHIASRPQATTGSHNQLHSQDMKANHKQQYTLNGMSCCFLVLLNVNEILAYYSISSLHTKHFKYTYGVYQSE